MSAVWLSPTRCALAVGGTEFFHGFEYFGLITLAAREFRVLLAVPSSVPVCVGFLSVAAELCLLPLLLGVG